MSTNEWREIVFPREEERDRQFRSHIDRLSVIGLRVIAAVCFGGVLYFALAAMLVPATAFDRKYALVQPVVITVLGLFSLGISLWRPAARYARVAGWLVGYGVAVAEFVAVSSIIERPDVAYYLFSGIVTGVMLVGIAALPLKPHQTLSLGAAIALTYAIAIPWLVPALADGRGAELVFIGQVVCLCTALTMVVYRQRVLAYRARRSAREALEELRDAQARLLVSENAHSQSRFAAALSHELNTPLGALTSAFDTLLHVYRKEGLDADERHAEVIAGAEAAGRGSAARLQETIERMRYLTNLDRAEEQTVDLNELCRETAASLQSDLQAKSDLDFDLGVLPPVRCRPQQLSAVLSNLLRNAADAIETRGRITVATRKRDGNVHLEVKDTGRGIPAAQLEKLFEPSFQVDGRRVTTTNWGLFVCRAIVTEHGGHLDIDSEVGKGTTARIVLPAAPRAEESTERAR